MPLLVKFRPVLQRQSEEMVGHLQIRFDDVGRLTGIIIEIEQGESDSLLDMRSTRTIATQLGHLPIAMWQMQFPATISADHGF